MTSSQSIDPAFLARVAGFLRTARRDLVDEVVTALARELDVYEALPAEVVEDVVAVVARNIDLFSSTLATAGPPDAAGLAAIERSAARRAEERIPLDVMIRAYPVAARVVFARTVAATAPPDEATVAAMTAVVLDYLTEVVSAAARGYVEEHDLIVGHVQSTRQVVLDALLEGRPLPEAWTAEVDLSGPMAVMAYSVLRSRTEPDTAVDAAIAARHRLRTVRHELERRFGARHLQTTGADGGLVLVSCATAPVTEAEMADTVRALAERADAPVLAAWSVTPVDHVAAAVRQVREVLEVARLTGRQGGLVTLDDVLPEYQLTRPGPARDRLVGLLAPLDGSPELVETLHHFLLNGGNRRRTGLDLHVHPNTVDYRNTKIARLTGRDPTDPDDVFVLRVAMIARLVATPSRRPRPAGPPPRR